MPMPMPVPRTGPVGYAWLRDQLGVPNFLGDREARVTNVQTLQALTDGGLLVPPAQPRCSHGCWNMFCSP